MTLFSLAVAIFLIANPIGAAPAFVALVKDFDFARQKQILLREAFFSLIMAYLFLFLGKPFLNILQIQPYALSISGGVVIFLVALYMIFPRKQTASSSTAKQIREPYFVPIATPLISGGGVFTTIVIYLSQTNDYLLMAEAITIAWLFIIPITYSAVYLQKLLGKGGLVALEQLMGMLLMMIGVELIVRGSQALSVAMHAT